MNIWDIVSEAASPRELVIALIAALVAALVLAIPVRMFLKRWGIASGKWVWDFTEDGIRYSEEIKCFQLGARICGTSELSYIENNQQKKAKYKFRGRCKHAIIAAYYRGVGFGNAEQGAFLLKHSVTQDLWKGTYLLFDRNDAAVSVDYVWRNQNPLRPLRKSEQ